MKRIIFLTVFLLSLSVLGMAQSSGTYTAKKTSTKTVKTYKYTPQFEKGWNLRPEISIDFPIKLEFLFSAGYQINPYIFIGLGIGVASFRPDIAQYSNAPFWYTTSFPLFATCRANFVTTKHGFTPFFETKMGYSFGVIGEPLNHISHQNFSILLGAEPSGFYGHWGIGGNYRNFDLLLSYHLLSYFVEELSFSSSSSSSSKNYYLDSHFSISIAYNIPIKKKN